MKLTRIRVKDFRSFSGDHEFDLADGVNYFVGPNNCGKSNLIRALELALDREARYDPERDRPARPTTIGAPPTTRITLTFRLGRTSPEITLLERAAAYELAVRSARKASTAGNGITYASDRELRMVTSFGVGGTRSTTFQAKGSGAASLPIDSAEHQRLEAQLWRVVRFAVIHSGEDLGSLLKGQFREILHLVINDHLAVELEAAQAARQEYLSALQLQLLEPLRQQVLQRVGWMFPEITIADLIPDVPTVANTLSSVDVRLGDVVTTRLQDKGTGVRGAVLVSMLRYLAEQSRRSLVLAVEEPEAFLHPGAQEAIRGELEGLADRDDVSLMVTTHSPYVMSRTRDSQVTELRKGPNGVTVKVDAVPGDQPRSTLLGALYRDAGLAHVLERSLNVPADTKLVVITEGFTDAHFLKLCCRAGGRGDLLAGIHFVAAGRAAEVPPQAVLARAATELPVVAILDHDEQGRAARDKLKSFGWSLNHGLLTLQRWPAACSHHDIEIEDLLPRGPVAALVEHLGEDKALDSEIKCGSVWHLQLSKAWKEAAIGSLEQHLTADMGGMAWLAEELWERRSKLLDARARDRGARANSATGKAG